MYKETTDMTGTDMTGTDMTGADMTGAYTNLVRAWGGLQHAVMCETESRVICHIGHVSDALRRCAWSTPGGKYCDWRAWMAHGGKARMERKLFERNMLTAQQCLRTIHFELIDWK